MPRALCVGLPLVAASLTWLCHAGTLAAPPAHPADELRRHLKMLGAAAWHDADHLGAGVKVAVLDTGFRDFRRLTADPVARVPGRRALPGAILTRSFRPDGQLEARDSQHGLLCAEVVHAIAPRAELLFANWDTEDPATFLAAVRWARSQGAKVLTCSVIMPSWSDGEGGGAVHAELDKLLGDDILFFASAGNIAQRHWTGPFQPNADGWHQWRHGRIGNALTPWGDERVSVELYGATDRPCELLVFDAAAGKVIGRCALHTETSEARNGGPRAWGRATVRFQPQARAAYQVVIRCSADRAGQDRAGEDRFHLVALGGSLEHSTTDCSIAFPADGARVQAVGAVDDRGTRLAYSSCGPIGRRAKPDFAAPVPFPTTLRERPFSGTSAAAPQAAALAAMLWSCRPHWRAQEVLAALRQSARDVGPLGQDCETGFGLIRLPGAGGGGENAVLSTEH